MQDHKRLSHYRQSSLNVRRGEQRSKYVPVNLGIKLIITITLIVSDPENKPKTMLSFVQKCEVQEMTGTCGIEEKSATRNFKYHLGHPKVNKSHRRVSVIHHQLLYLAKPSLIL